MRRDAQTEIILADDHPIVLAGLKFLLDKSEEFNVTSYLYNGITALEQIRKTEPDIAILDVNMPNLDGIKILESLEFSGSKTRVVFLTGTLTDAQMIRAVELGVWGVLMKEAAAHDLIECLRAVVRDERWLPSELVLPAVQRESRRLENDRGRHLTVRERQISSLIADGMSNKQIARITGISEGTVKVHLHNIFQKLDVSNRASLAVAARDFLQSDGKLG